MGGHDEYIRRLQQAISARDEDACDAIMQDISSLFLRACTSAAKWDRENIFASMTERLSIETSWSFASENLASVTMQFWLGLSEEEQRGVLLAILGRVSQLTSPPVALVLADRCAPHVWQSAEVSKHCLALAKQSPLFAKFLVDAVESRIRKADFEGSSDEAQYLRQLLSTARVN